MFDTPAQLALGLITGILFGVLLQKGRVAKFDVIVGQFLFRDWTVVKVMGTAVVIGAIGVYAMVSADAASLHIKPFLLGGILVGAVCFGIGMSVLGYCPGTSVAACGEGRVDAVAGVFGMILGAFLFVAFFNSVQGVMEGYGDYGKQTLPELTQSSPWLWVAVLTVIGAVGLFIDRQNRAPSVNDKAASSHTEI